MPTTTPFAPFTDFRATPAEAEQLRQLLSDDLATNLEERFRFFLEQDPERVMTSLGFVPLILENAFTTIGVPRDDGPDMAFSVGFHYALGLPDLMLLDLADVGIGAMQPVIQEVGERLGEGLGDDIDDELEPARSSEARRQDDTPGVQAPRPARAEGRGGQREVPPEEPLRLWPLLLLALHGPPRTCLWSPPGSGASGRRA